MDLRAPAALALTASLSSACAAPNTGTAAPSAVPSTSTPAPVATLSTVPAVSCQVGPRRLPDGGRRWWSSDHRCYTSPWFAGAHKIMLNFGCTPAPYYDHDPRCPGREGFHHGLDIDMPMETPIYAGTAGVVVATTGDGPAYGTHPVKIWTGAYDVLLGHLDRSVVTIGQQVKAGQLLGYSGESGAPDGPHLHFEVRPHGDNFSGAVDPSAVLGLVAR